MRPAVLAVLLCAVQVVSTAGNAQRRVLGRRQDHIDVQRARGGAFQLLSEDSAQAVLRLRDETPEDALIVVAGPWQGGLELAPALLWPRLCLWSLQPEERPRQARLLDEDGRRRTVTLVAEDEGTLILRNSGKAPR